MQGQQSQQSSLPEATGFEFVTPEMEQEFIKDTESRFLALVETMWKIYQNRPVN